MKIIQLTASDKKALSFIKEVFIKFPESRNKDIDAILAVWKYQGVKLDVRTEILIRKCFSPIVIVKCKRYLQGMGLYKFKPITEQGKIPLDNSIS